MTVPRTFPSWADLLSANIACHKIRDMFPHPKKKKILEVQSFRLSVIICKEKYKTAVYSNFAEIFFTCADFGFEEVHTPNFKCKDFSNPKEFRVSSFLTSHSNRLILLRAEITSEEINDSQIWVTAMGYYPTFTLSSEKKKSNPFFQCIFISNIFPYSPRILNIKFTDPKVLWKIQIF